MNKRGVITFVDYKVNRIEFKNNDEYEGEKLILSLMYHHIVIFPMMVRK